MALNYKKIGEKVMARHFDYKHEGELIEFFVVFFRQSETNENMIELQLVNRERKLVIWSKPYNPDDIILFSPQYN